MKPGNNGYHSIGTVGVGAIDAEPDQTVLAGDEMGAPEIEVNKNRSRRRKRLIGGALLILLFIVLCFSLYLMSGRRTPVHLQVKDTRPQEGQQRSVERTPDDVTAEAIAEVRSATPASAPPAVSANTTIPSSPSVKEPVVLTTSTVTPVTSISDPTVSEPAKDNSAAPTSASNTSGSRRSQERSIRCAVPVNVASNSVQPASTSSVSNTNQQHQSVIRRQSSTEGIVLPGFGSMLPVRTLGALYTLRQGSLARFELTRDVRGEGWSMRKGTVLVGVSRGSEMDRAFMSIVGFIDPDTARLVKLTGDVLGSDGGVGLKGKRHKLSNGWSRALRQIGSSAASLTGTVVAATTGRPIIVTDVNSLTNPVSYKLGNLAGDRNRQNSFVEVPAGTAGYVMITRLPQEIRGVDALGEMTAEDLAKQTDTDTRRASTGLTEQEMANLLSSGSPEQIRAALPSMTPETRRIAEAVLKESGE